MKTKILFAFVFLAYSISFSQTIEETVEKRTNEIATKLSLTKKEKEKLYSISLEKEKEIQKIRQEHKGDKTSLVKEIRSLHPSYNAKIRQVIGREMMPDYFVHFKEVSNKYKIKNVTATKVEKPSKLSKKAKENLEKYAKTIQFKSSKATFKTGVSKSLDKIVTIMNQYKTINFEIQGHSDSTGNDKMNLKLSQKRAQAVLNYFTKKGIDTTRLKAKGYGETKPITTNNTAAGRAKNRRVEIVVIP